MDDKSFQRAVKNQQNYVKGIETEASDRAFWLVVGFLCCVALTAWALGKLLGLL